MRSMRARAATDGRRGSPPRGWVAATVLAAALLGFADPGAAETITLVVDVSTVGSIGMGGMGGAMMTFEFPGLGTAFAMLAGGTPWAGANGILIGGTGALEGIAGRVSVGPAAGANTYPFTFEFTRP